MIQSRIELDFLITVIAFYFYPGQLFVPIILHSCQVFVEIIIGYFGCQITCRPFHTHTGDGSTNKNLFSFLSLKVESCNDGCPYPLAIFLYGSCIELHHNKRFGETGTEVEALVACPTVRVTVTLHRYRIDDFYVRIIGKIPIHGFPQIQENGSIGFGESIPLNATTLGGRQLYIDIIIFQTHLVISGACRLFRMREQRVNAERSFRLLIRQCHRHKRDIIQVTSAGSGEMGMAEACNGTVWIKISGNTVPARQSVVRTELHHAKRRLGTRIGVSSKICTDKGIHKLCIRHTLHIRHLRGACQKG